MKRTNNNVEYATTPSNVDAADPLRIGDLRPMLRDLNWQLRRIGVSLCVQIADSKEDTANRSIVSGVYLGPAKWIVTCEKCKHEYEPGRERVPKCPQCGEAEYSK